jgi:branched-chain amino acid transport system substrate-binding protein
LWNLSGQGEVLWNILSAGHVPELINGTSDAGPLSGKYSYLVQNQLALGFAGAAAIAGKAKAKHAALFVIDVPAAAGPARSLMVKLYKAAGVPSGDVVTIPPGTADMSAQVQAEINKGVDFIYVIGDTTFCTTLLKAATSLAYNGTTTVLANRVAPSGVAALPNGYAGIKTVTDTTSSPSNKDVQAYLAAMKKWESGSDPFANGNTAGGFSTIVDFARAMTNASGTTSADMEAALKSMAPQSMFFGAGLTFQCDGKQVPTAPGICSSGALEETLDKNGQPAGAPTALNTSALLSASS